MTFTATVSASLPPTGIVTFKDGVAILGSATLILGTASFTTATLAAGSHEITVSYGGDLLTSASTSTTLTQAVTPAPLTVRAADSSKVYGAALPSMSVSYSGFVNGDSPASLTAQAIASSTATAMSHVGIYVIGASGAVGPNYTISYSYGSLTVTPAPLMITAISTSMTYGGAMPPFTVGFSGFVNGDLPSGLTTLPTSSTTASSGSPIGSYPITVNGADDPNYTISYIDGTLTVGKATLIVTVNNDRRTYGDANPGLTGSMAGIVNGDRITATYDTVAVASSPVGTYSITQSLADPDGRLGNYAVTTITGTLAITKAGLIVTADDRIRTHGDQNPSFSASYRGFQNGETPATSGITGVPVLGTAATPTSPAGHYTITAAPGTLAADNYSLSFAEGTLTITPAPPTDPGPPDDGRPADITPSDIPAPPTDFDTPAPSSMGDLISVSDAIVADADPKPREVEFIGELESDGGDTGDTNG